MKISPRGTLKPPPFFLPFYFQDVNQAFPPPPSEFSLLKRPVKGKINKNIELSTCKPQLKPTKGSIWWGVKASTQTNAPGEGERRGYIGRMLSNRFGVNSNSKKRGKGKSQPQEQAKLRGLRSFCSAPQQKTMKSLLNLPEMNRFNKKKEHQGVPTLLGDAPLADEHLWATLFLPLLLPIEFYFFLRPFIWFQVVLFHFIPFYSIKKEKLFHLLSFANTRPAVCALTEGVLLNP